MTDDNLPKSREPGIPHHRSDPRAARTTLDLRERELDRKAREVEARAHELEGRLRLSAQRPEMLVEMKQRFEREALAIRDRREQLVLERKALECDRKNLEQMELAVPEVDDRTRFLFQMHVNVSFYSQDNFWTNLSLDISEGGIFIATRERIALGTLLEVNLSISRQPPACLIGEVRWTREYNEYTGDQPPGLGIKFLEVSAEARAVIHAFMQKRAPLLYEDAAC